MEEKLIQNSKASQLACIEIHNKPIFPFRYETCAILNINAWELLFKAYILRYHKKVKVINNDGTTKPFDECLNFVNSELGKEFLIAHQNIEKIYEYRCNIIHFYQDNIDVLLYSLLSKNILLYHEFLLKYFAVDIASETNLILLPIGFKKPISPIDFLSNESSIKNSSSAVQTFVKSIVKSTETLTASGYDDSIFFNFKMSLINESRVKNADIVAAITKDETKAAITVGNVLGQFVLTDDENQEGVKRVKIDEETLFKEVYTQTFDQVVKTSKKMFSDFLQNPRFNKIMKGLKDKPTFHKKRFLDIQKQSGGYKDYYTEKVYDELARHYKKR